MREFFRAWTERSETFVLDVILGGRRGKRAAILRGVLFALSKVFTGAVKARRFLYNARILRDSTLGVQVIAIGNLTVGETGKTPVRINMFSTKTIHRAAEQSSMLLLFSKPEINDGFHFGGLITKTAGIVCNQ